MIWAILVVLLVVGFIFYRGMRRVLMSVRAAKLGLNNKDWQALSFHSPSMPMRMAFSEVATKSAYQSNFKVMFSRFVEIAQLADNALNPDAVGVISRQLLSDISIENLRNIEPPSNSKIAKDFYMVQSAVLFAMICTQDKGANIKHRLMEGRNGQSGGDIYTQQKTNKEYFEFMNNQHPNFCQLVGILEPRKAALIETVAGYLLTD